MPGKNGKRKQARGNRSKSSRGSSRNNVSASSLALGMAGSSSDDHVVMADMQLRPVSNTFYSRPPRSLFNQIYFVRQDQCTTQTTNTTTISENNYNWSASNNLIQLSNFAAIFDQYALYSAVVSISNLSNNAAVASLPQVFTAIDFDNTSSIGLVGIQAFSSCNADILKPGGSVTRIIVPNTKVSNGSVAGSGMSRNWLDMAAPSVAWLGLRTIANNTPGAAIVLDVSFSLTWAFRNTI